MRAESHERNDFLPLVQRAETELQEAEAESLVESLPEGFRTDTQKKRPKVYQTLIPNTQIVIGIWFGSVFGVLARKGLIALTTYNGSYLSGVVWANFTACVVMGIMVSSSNFWENAITSKGVAAKGSLPFYVALSTGWCGTCLSFSSFILEAFYKSADLEPNMIYKYPNQAYGIMEFLAVVIAQLAVSLLGLSIGKHFVEIFDEYCPRVSTKIYDAFYYFTSFLGIAAYIITIVLIPVKHEGAWRSWTFSILFAPFGALVRFYISKYLNSKVANFPLGTFTANFAGTLLLAIFLLLSRGVALDKNRLVTHVLHCQVLVGLSDGFCGALTTVSTFVVELLGLKPKHAYLYAFYSVGICYILTVLVLGSYAWKIDLTKPLCS